MSLKDCEEIIENELIKTTFSTGIDVIGAAILGPLWSV